MSTRDDAELVGTVSGFDESRGLGTVRAADGREFPFHCVEIADGSRTIVTGASVRFRVAFRVLRREAVDIRPA